MTKVRVLKNSGLPTSIGKVYEVDENSAHYANRPELTRDEYIEIVLTEADADFGINLNDTWPLYRGDNTAFADDWEVVENGLWANLKGVFRK